MVLFASWAIEDFWASPQTLFALMQKALGEKSLIQ
jgi:hypothetical protein